MLSERKKVSMSTAKKTEDNEVKSTKKNTKKAPKKSATSKAEKALVEVNEALATEKDKFLRLFAEFENYKKRTSKERIELFKTAGKK